MSRSPKLSPEARRAGDSFARLVDVMAQLRAPDGCPWDREQTHSSLSIHLLEEAHETVDAIDRADLTDLKEELGDLLLQIVFHAEIASESDSFDATSVIDDLIAKLIGRHPHVFGDLEVSGAKEVLANWEALKREHKGRRHMGEDLPKNLPALLLAYKALRRLAGAKRDHSPSQQRLRDYAERLNESPSEESVGGLLFEAVALAASAGIDPEGALRRRALESLRAGSDGGEEQAQS